MHAITNSFSREITSHFDTYFKRHKLATSYVELILLVYNKTEITQKSLAEEMNLAPSTITRFVQKLVKKDLLKKSKTGRIASIQLTLKAEKLAQELTISYNKAVADLEEKLGEKFVHTTEQLLQHGTTLLSQE